MYMLNAKKNPKLSHLRWKSEAKRESENKNNVEVLKTERITPEKAKINVAIVHTK